MHLPNAGPQNYWRGTILAALLVVGCDLGTPPPSPADVRPETDGGADAVDTVDTAQPVPVGESCEAPGECVDDARCIGNPNGVFSCMRTCDQAWTTCDNGSLCTPVGDGSRVCYTGGASAAGTSCRSNLQCEDGLLCVGVEENDFSCLRGCHLERGSCEADEFCRPLSEPPRGYCRSQVGARCGGPDQVCGTELDCSTNLSDPIRPKFPDGYCTLECSSDGECPGSARCRTYPGTEVDVCFSSCEFEADCRLTSSYGCLESDDCASQARSEECEALRGGASLCVPSELLDWSPE